MLSSRSNTASGAVNTVKGGFERLCHQNLQVTSNFKIIPIHKLEDTFSMRSIAGPKNQS